MRLLCAFIHDNRYSVPTLRLAEAVEEGCEAEYAESLLVQSPHYYAVELRDEDDLVVHVSRSHIPSASKDQSSGVGA